LCEREKRREKIPISYYLSINQPIIRKGHEIKSSSQAYKLLKPNGMGDQQMTIMEAASKSPQVINVQLREVLTHFPEIVFAVLFGSVASDRQRADSDLDIAVASTQTLTAHEKNFSYQCVSREYRTTC